MGKKKPMTRERNRDNETIKTKTPLPDSVRITRALASQKVKNTRNSAAIAKLSSNLQKGEERVLELEMALEEAKAKESK